MDQFFEIRKVVEPVAADYGYEVVRLKWLGSEDGKILQIMVEPTDGGRTNIDTCGKISGDISAILDVEELISDKYNLEVTSPGIDRPLTRLKDYERFGGMEAKLETKLQVDGRKRFKGKIGKVDEENIKVEIEGGEVIQLRFNDINEAKLVMTDELIREALKASK